MWTRRLSPLAAVCAAILVTAPASEAAYDYKVPCDKTARAGKPLTRGFNCRTVVVQRYPRRYVVYVPRDNSFELNRKAPLVLGFHGSGGSGGNFIKNGWVRQAERNGVLLAFGTALEASIVPEGGHVETKWVTPESAPTIDPDVKPRRYPASADWPANDTAFVRRMLTDVDDATKVDDKRVYTAGFSNGANMAAEVVVDNPGDMAAVAGFGGSHTVERDVAEPVPYFLAFGQNDRHLGRPADLPVPLDPSTWPQYPLWTDRVETTASNWGVDEQPQVSRRAALTRLLWELDTGVLAISLLAELGHSYPSFGAKVSWKFFERYAS